MRLFHMAAVLPSSVHVVCRYVHLVPVTLVALCSCLLNQEETGLPTESPFILFFVITFPSSLFLPGFVIGQRPFV